MNIGIKGMQKVVVSEKNSAKTMRSGTLDVFATPAMIALMEETAWKSIAQELEDGCGTVGIHMDVSHDAPTPSGMTVTCESELIAIDGRKLTFRVEAKDERGLIGKGIHERFIVNNEKFQAKANQK
ncbi:MAG: thioesterase family protein [Eubacterium sp.]